MMCDDAEDSESAFVIKEANLTDRSQQKWLIDSGSSKHMTCDKEILQEFQHFSKAQSVKRADDRVVDALGMVNVNMKMTFKLSDVKIMSQCMKCCMFQNCLGICSQWELLLKRKIWCSSKGLTATYIGKKGNTSRNGSSNS